MKKIMIFFDGTGNEPSDAKREISTNGEIKDNGISNVLKLHLMCGGSIGNVTNHYHDQLCYYYSGVGTRGSVIRQLVRKAIAAKAPNLIMQEALDDIEKVYEKEDRLYIFGFSRGAAIARKFASIIARDGLQTSHGELDKNPVVDVLGVWDTVASFGKPNLKKKSKPISDVLFENNSIAPIIRNAYHMVSLDENRLAFRPTLMNHQECVEEVWFPGVHSDVGGGYFHDGISDISLEWMLNKVQNHDINLLSVDDIQSSSLQGKDQNDQIVTIRKSDLEVVPKPGGKMHSHKRFWRKGLVKKFTQAPRDLMVISNNVESERLPLVHCSVEQRMSKVKKYTPASLKGEAYRVIGGNGEISSPRIN